MFRTHNIDLRKVGEIAPVLVFGYMAGMAGLGAWIALTSMPLFGAVDGIMHAGAAYFLYQAGHLDEPGDVE